MCAQRRPAPYEQTTEKKIAKHSNDLKRQKRGEIKIRHRHRDTTSVVSSVNSNVSHALTVRKPVKPQPKLRRQTNLTEPSDMASTSPLQLISIVPVSHFLFKFVPVFVPRIDFLMCVMLLYLLQFGSFACYNYTLYSLCESIVISLFVHLT